MKRKILIMQPELCMGGVERVLLTLLKNINLDKFNVTLFLRNRNIWDDEVPKRINIRYLCNEDPTKNGAFKARMYKYGLILLPGWLLQQALKLKGYDVYVSFHEPMMNFLKGAKGKKIAWIHTDYSVVKDFAEVNQLTKKDGVLGRLINYARIRVFHQCDKIVCVANSAIKGVVSKTNVEPKKVICKYNLNDEDNIRKLSSEEESIIDANNDEVKICSIGRFVEQKAFHRFIYIASELKRMKYNFKIYIVGDGPLRKKIENSIIEHDLNDYLILVGYDKNPYKYIAKSDFFACSSLYEAFCTATTESIILGVPIVTTDCSGMEELIGDTKAGLIVENNEIALFEGIKQVLDNKLLYREMKKDAIIRGKEFESSKLISEIEKLLDE